MHTLTFEVDQRLSSGKNAAKQLRFSGFVPGVVYGEHTDPIHVTINGREMSKFHRDYRRENVLITMKIKNADHSVKEVTVIPKEISRDAISLDIIHVDFLMIDPSHPIRTEVRIEFQGTAPGVKKGGNLMISHRNLKIRSLPADVPQSIAVDLSNLEVGQTIRIRDLALDKIQILHPADEIIVLCESTKVQEAAEATEATVAPAAA